MRVALIDYGSGNLRSAAKAIERAALDNGLPLKLDVTADPGLVAAADRVVLPGVGAFGDCYRGLAALDGMIETLSAAVIEKGRPFLGICVGMQLMAERGLEHGEHTGLGWIPGTVRMLEPAKPGQGDAALKIPHMGWNQLHLHAQDGVAKHALLDGIAEGAHAYFVHSYHLQASDPRHVLASVDYGGPVTAAVGRDNLFGTQFHPEKSQATGLRLLANFLRWQP